MDEYQSQPRCVLVGGLTGPRLGGRLLREEDRPHYRALYAHAEVMRWIGPTLSPERADAVFARALAHNTARHPGHRFWTIFERQSGARIGLISLRRNGSSAELGYMSFPDWWNRGYAREAFAMAAAAGFQDGLQTVIVSRPDDEQAQRLMRVLAPLGFAPEPGASGERRWRLGAPAPARP